MEPWDDAIDRYADWLSAGGASPGTLKLRRSYLSRLSTHCGTLSPWLADVDMLTAFLSVRGWSAETRKSARTTVRTFYEFAAKTGRVDHDPSLQLPRIYVPPASPRPAPADVIERAWARADDRGRLLIMCALLAGLRRAEIAGLHTRNVEGEVLRVKGKRARWRSIPLHPTLREALHRLPQGYVFPGKINGHLSPDRVGRILADLLGNGWSAHTLRHAFASVAHDASHDLLAVSAMLGHSRVSTTQVYTAVRPRSMVEAVLAVGELLNPCSG